MLHACDAFNQLAADEQHIFVDGLHHIMQAGEPIPPFDHNVMAEARDWASWASDVEIRAYAAACWEMLPEGQRGRFIAWASSHGQEAAA